MMNKRLVILGAGIGRLGVIKELRESGVPLDDLDIAIVDDDFSHFLGFTLPWVMRGWRDHPPAPAFLRAAPREEARGAGLARTVAMQSLLPRLLSGVQQRVLAQGLNPQAKSPWSISAAITSAGAAS
jgi:hypothetical protein